MKSSILLSFIATYYFTCYFMQKSLYLFTAVCAAGETLGICRKATACNSLIRAIFPRRANVIFRGQAFRPPPSITLLFDLKRSRFPFSASPLIRFSRPRILRLLSPLPIPLTWAPGPVFRILTKTISFSTDADERPASSHAGLRRWKISIFSVAFFFHIFSRPRRGVCHENQLSRF